MAATRLDDRMTAPAGVTAFELEHAVVEGMRLRIGCCRPAQAKERGTVVVLTGRAEFIEKYDEATRELAARGFAVAIFDWRGQGGSDRFLDRRHPGHVPRIEDYLTDLAAVLDHLEHRRLPRPFLMLAHSMGGHIGLRHLREHPGHFAGAMMSAPMFGIDLRPLPQPVARAICALAIGLGGVHRYAPGQRDFDLARLVYATNKLTNCPIQFEDLRRLLETTPELAVGGVTYGWLAASLRSIALTRQPGYLESITIPVLVCQAGQDRVVCNRSIPELTRRLPQGRLLIFPEAKHELLRERDPIRRQVLDAFVGFADEVTRRP